MIRRQAFSAEEFEAFNNKLERNRDEEREGCVSLRRYQP